VASAPTLLILCLALISFGVFAGLPQSVVGGGVTVVIALVLFRTSRVACAREGGSAGPVIVRNLFRTYAFDDLAEGRNLKYRALRIIGPASTLFVRTSSGAWVPILRLIPATMEDIRTEE
jgi:hypothetical protein